MARHLPLSLFRCEKCAWWWWYDDDNDDYNDNDNGNDNDDDNDDDENDNLYLKLFYIRMKDEVKVDEYYPFMKLTFNILPFYKVDIKNINLSQNLHWKYNPFINLTFNMLADRYSRPIIENIILLQSWYWKYL